MAKNQQMTTDDIGGDDDLGLEEEGAEEEIDLPPPPPEKKKAGRPATPPAQAAAAPAPPPLPPPTPTGFTPTNGTQRATKPAAAKNQQSVDWRQVMGGVKTQLAQIKSLLIQRDTGKSLKSAAKITEALVWIDDDARDLKA